MFFFFFFFLDKCLDVSPLQRTLTKPWRNTDIDTDANPRFTIAVHLRIFTFVYENSRRRSRIDVGLEYFTSIER